MYNYSSITFLVSNRCSYSQDYDTVGMCATFYDVENDTFKQGMVETTNDFFRIENGAELVIDFENNKIYIDENEIIGLLLPDRTPLNLNNVTNIEIVQFTN